MTMAPQSGQTRWAQHAASPPSGGGSSNPARTAAWLCSTSRVAVSKVTGPAASSARNPSRAARAGPWLSSAA